MLNYVTVLRRRTASLQETDHICSHPNQLWQNAQGWHEDQFFLITYN